MELTSDCARFIIYSNGTTYDNKLKQTVPISMSAGPARYAKFSVNITLNGNTDRIRNTTLTAKKVEPTKLLQVKQTKV